MSGFFKDNPPATQVGSEDATESTIAEDAVTQTDTSGGFYQGSPDQTTTDAYTADALASKNAAEAAKVAAEAAQAASESAKTAAETAETNAETAETNAETAETNAAASQSAAATSATNAAGSAATATTKASEAATSATNAATSATSAETAKTAAETAETNAETAETNAASSASSASTSASNASTSATAASGSASAASTSETNAASSATAAATSATNAATSETNAASSATSASGSAATATTQASTSTTQAGNSATSATAASNSASSAASAQTAAEAARDSALAALDSFDDRYLGSKSSAPTLDNDGNALVSGALYFDSTSNAMKVYDGSQWLNAYASLSGALIANQNLSDLTNAATARTNLGLGTAATTASSDYATAAQGTTADNALAASSVSTFGGTLIDDADAAAARTTLGLGTAATTASSDYATAAQADQTVALTGAGATTISGTYPNFTITSTDTNTDTNTEYTAGSGITLTGTVFSNSAPDQTVALTGSGGTTVSGTYPNFTISSAASIDGTTINPAAVQIGGTTVIDSSRSFSASGTGSSTAPPLSITSSNASTFIHASNSYAPNMTAGQFHGHFFGKSGSTKNAGGIGYYWAGSGSNSNFVSIGHWGADHLLRIYGDGNVTSGKVSVTGLDESFVARRDLASSSSTWGARIISSNATTNVAAFLGNYQGYAGLFGHSAGLDAWRPIYINAFGSSNANVFTGSLYVNGNNVAWHAGNDGSGSGLDADLLDGVQATGFMRQLSDASSPNYTTPSSRRVNPNSSNPTNAHHAIVTFGNDGNVTGQLATHFVSGQPYTRGYNSAWSPWRTIWTDANDGSGSGLDADTVDGIQGASFLRSDASDSIAAGTTYTFGTSDAEGLRFTNSSYAKSLYIGGWSNANSSGISRIRNSNDNLHLDAGSAGHLYLNHYCTGNVYARGQVVWHAGNDGSGSGLDADLFDGSDSVSFLRYVSTVGSGANWDTLANSANTMRMDQVNNGMGGTGAPGNYSYGQVWSSKGPNHNFQLYASHTAAGGDGLRYRTGWQNAYYGWVELWDSANDGSGSGLDADTVDGIHGSSFVRKDGNNSYTANVYNYFYVARGGYSGALNTASLQAYTTGANSAFMSFHRSAQYAVNMGLDADNVLRIGGWSAPANRWVLDMSGNMTAAGNVTAYSDIRLKESIEVIPNALEKVKQIRGVTFTRNDQEDKELRHTGVIAQEVEKVLPEVVSEDNLGVKNVAYGNMVGLLIEAIKELKTEVDDLKKQLREK